MSQEISEIKSVATLMEYVRAEYESSNRPITLELGFHPKAVGPYGKEESQWSMVVRRTTTYIIDYGATIEEAADQLLDRVLHPENYPLPEEDD